MHFRSRNVRFGSYLRRSDVMYEVVLHPLVCYKTEMSRTGENCGKPCGLKLRILVHLGFSLYELPRDKTNKVACAPSEDSDQPGHPPSLIRVFAVSMKKARVLSYPLSAQPRRWSDWATSHADLSLRWAQSFCCVCHEAAQLYYWH